MVAPGVAPPGLIDTHCHLDAGEYAADRAAVVERARVAGVGAIVIPAVQPDGFAEMVSMAHAMAGPVLAYALGIHPLAVPAVGDDALDQLADALTERRDDPRLVAVGEIGLDYFVDDPDPARQERFFEAQLALAARFGLPVLVHSRKANDRVARALRRTPVPGGISHAFNGSAQQAQVLVGLGMRLGFGGVMTFPRSRQIRARAAACPMSSIVLETDGPDLSPAWRSPGRNEPAELPGIADCLAGLRRMSVDDVVATTSRNALDTLPRLARLIDGLGRPA
jgi:TatD DNase family protein